MAEICSLPVAVAQLVGDGDAVAMEATGFVLAVASASAWTEPPSAEESEALAELLSR